MGSSEHLRGPAPCAYDRYNPSMGSCAQIPGNGQPGSCTPPGGGAMRQAPWPPSSNGPPPAMGTGHPSPQPPWGHNWDMHRPDPRDPASAFANAAVRQACWPTSQGAIPPGHHAGGYGDPYAQPPMPPQDTRGSAKGPVGHAFPSYLARLPTPAKAPGPAPVPAPARTPSPEPTDRSMLNTFRDSTEFTDAGMESEAEFLSSRSMMPNRQKKGSRSHRQLEESSCLSCLKWY